MRKHPRRALQEAIAFLKFPSRSTSELRDGVKEQEDLRQRHGHISSPLRDAREAHRRLCRFYEAFNTELVHLLDGDERFHFRECHTISDM